jgi:mannosidase alpha-like ER degradation enhancer 2
MSSIQAIDTYLADTRSGGLWYGYADMNTGKRIRTQFGSLDAFFPAVLALSGDIPRATQLEDSCLTMWNRYGIEPEPFDYATAEAVSPEYLLRPEIIESAYYLYHFTRNEKYLSMGKMFFDSLRAYCRTDAGYAELTSVVTKAKADRMESFFLAETLKYLYLLFAPSETLDFENVIFNTEAHPIRRTW